MEITGIIVNVLPTLSGQGKNGEWVKNSFVIEWTDNGYTQKLCLEVMGAEKFEKMKNAVKVGNDVLCKFSVSSREYNGKYFTSCNCWYCSLVGAADAQQTAVHNAQPAPSAEQQQQNTLNSDPLPF